MTDTFMIIIGLGVLASLGLHFVTLLRTGKTPDAALTETFQRMQTDRDTMERMERMAADAHSTTRQALTLISGGANLIAPMTPLQSDDAFAKWLADMLEPGSQVQAVITQAVAEEIPKYAPQVMTELEPQIENVALKAVNKALDRPDPDAMG